MKTQFFILLAALLLLSGGFVACDGPDEKKIEIPEEPVALHDDYYYNDGEKISLIALESLYYMVFPTKSTEAVIEALNKNGIKTPETYAERFTFFPELADCSMAFVETGKPLFIEMIPDLVYLSHNYRSVYGSEMIVTNFLEVGLRDEEQDLAKLEEFASKYNVMIQRDDISDRPGLFILYCTKESKGNALEMANLLYESGKFEYVQPLIEYESMPL